ncbi:hypothetical protein LTR62_005427 [Meristemomyces frigidus]|uniref:Dynein intermediate chain n=1 Tax=Meristemomyces frigidus TaxID=1508187 RepID=A0AAN7YFH8_9PEZI|nr:hypothetical protein LTR62_005427 [Meristemomyces frigidus]
MSSLQSRKDEIAAKKAKLAELKRQRELRAKDLSHSRQSIGGPGGNLAEVRNASPLRSGRTTQSREDIDSLISSLVPDRPSSSSGTRTPARSPGKRASGVEQARDGSQPPTTKLYQDAATDTLSFAEFQTVYEIPVESKAEVINYSKGVQTTEVWEDDDHELGFTGRGTSLDRRRREGLSDRERELEEESIRQRLRVEIEEELRALELEDKTVPDKDRFPVRSLQPEELNVVTSSNDFLDFVERSSKVIERALDEEYDLLADYAQLNSLDSVNDADDDYTGRRGRRIKEIASFPLTDQMGTKRMISSLDFSPKFPELLCTAYTKSQTSPHTPPGLLNIWNLHLKGRPEYSLNATSDLLSCLFHPYHPSLILGGTYSGQLCLWDTRSRNQRTGEPVQKTPLTGGRTGHAHPIYSLAVVGTQNASSVVSVSTDGVVCAWSTDMLTQPQEYLELHAPANSSGPGAFKTDDVAPTSISFPASDPTYFLAGTEQGAILPVHRYDRAAAKAGVDARVSYLGHMAPVTALDFHPSRGKVDLGDLFVSAGMDWSVKVWRAKAGAGAGGSQLQGEAVKPLLEIQREDTVYDVRWSPTKPAVFGLVDGGGLLDIYDLLVSTEVPVASATPSQHQNSADTLGFASSGGSGMKSLARLAWEKSQGKVVAVGGLDGVSTVFEVGEELGGLETKAESWVGMRKLVGRLGRAGG